jgi:acetyl esterase/lipase
MMNEQSKAQIDVVYDDQADLVMDIFSPGPYVEATVIFLYGGFWSDYEKSVFSYLAMGPVLNNMRVIIPTLPKCPEVTIPEINNSFQKCLRSVCRRFTGDILLVGQQSGAHSIGRSIIKDELSESILDRIKHVMLISPIVDLKPLLYTNKRDELKLTEEIANSETLTDLDLADKMKVTIWVGADERPIYLEQAQQLATAWRCGWIKSINQHHLDIADGLGKNTSKLMNTLLAYRF